MDLKCCVVENSLKIIVQFGKLNSKQTQSIWRIYLQMLFYCKEMEERIMDKSRFTITTIVENGYPHYKVYDNLTDKEIHCDLNELNETIWQLLEV